MAESRSRSIDEYTDQRLPGMRILFRSLEEHEVSSSSILSDDYEMLVSDQGRNHIAFWKDIIYKDGTLDEEAVLNELMDYSDMMDRFGVFLDEATGSRMSKLNYTTEAMLSCLNEHIEDCVNAAIEEERKYPSQEAK